MKEQKIICIYEGESVNFVYEIIEGHKRFNSLKTVLFWLATEEGVKLEIGRDDKES